MAQSFGPVKDAPWSFQRNWMGGSNIRAAIFLGSLMGLMGVPYGLVLIVSHGELDLRAVRIIATIYLFGFCLSTVIMWISLLVKRSNPQERWETIVWYISPSIPVVTDRTARRTLAVVAVGLAVLAAVRVAELMAGYSDLGRVPFYAAGLVAIVVVLRRSRCVAIEDTDE